MGIPEGEQRCHGTCNVGQQPLNRAIRDWEILARPQVQCEASHHRPPSRLPIPTATGDLAQFVEGVTSHIPALLLKNDGLEHVYLDMPQEQRAAFRRTATEWELSHSKILTLVGWTPLIDDSNTVLAYATMIWRAPCQVLKVVDLEGTALTESTGECVGLGDSIGNDILATIVTLGGAVVVRAVARGVLSRAATSLGSAVTRISIAAARGISAEAEKGMLLFLRSLRARVIVRSLERRGLKVIVNLGGEGAQHEIAAFGEHIALNHQVRMAIGKRFVPNLVKEPADNLGRVFAESTVDKVVSRRLDAVFDTDLVARGAFRVLKSGGELEMHMFTNSAEFGSRFVASLARAGFPPGSIQNIGNTLFRAVKP